MDMELSSRRKTLALGIISALGLAAVGVSYHYKFSPKFRHHDSDDMDSDLDEDDDFKCEQARRRRLEQDVSGSDSSDSDDVLNKSCRSMSEHPMNLFNSSRLNVFNSSRLNEDLCGLNDSTSKLHDLSAEKLLPDNVKFMTFDHLLALVQHNDIDNDNDNTINYLLIDLRGVDYVGGHIAGSMNIPDDKFYDQLPQLLYKYHATPIVIVQCMDSSLRSIENIEYYAKARKELIKYYNVSTQQSYYYQYKLKLQHSAHKTVLRSVQWNNPGWMERFVEKKKINVDFSLYPNMYSNLKQQRLYVVAGGFFDFINTLRNDSTVEPDSMEFHDIIVDFDTKYWEQLMVMGEKKLYHKIEYYTTRRMNPLRKTQTKRVF